MEMSYTIVNAIWRPNFLLKYDHLRRAVSSPTGSFSPISWEKSALNPKNRPESLDTIETSWRIDGATGCGTRFFSVNTDPLSDQTPTQIFVYLPDQTSWPPALRTCLDGSRSVPLRDSGAIANLGIASHICRALGHQVNSNPNFPTLFRKLPFGSKLVFENVTANVSEMRLTLVPNYDTEARSKILADLKSEWHLDVSGDSWPPSIDVDSLCLVTQLHDTVSIVAVRDAGPDSIGSGFSSSTLFVLKSAVDDLDHLYHELRFLLSIPAHPNIMPRPIGIVHKRAAFGGKRGIVGFLLPYYPSGSLRDILPARKRQRTLPDSVKLKWCQQVTAAHIHVLEQGHTFYADLRPDNVILKRNAQGEEDVLLCDFEQRGNWHEWSAPEVLYRQYVENLRTACEDHGLYPGDNRLKQRLTELLSSCAPNSPSNESCNGSEGETPVERANRAWFTLSEQEREQAMVYSLGLFIYVVFEGLSNVRNNIANKWAYELEIEFPIMKQTPPEIQEIVWQCVGSGQQQILRLLRQVPRVVKLDEWLFPEDDVNLERGTRESAERVLQTAWTWWDTELSRAESFLRARTDGDGVECGKSCRPSLHNIMASLEEVKLSDDIL